MTEDQIAALDVRKLRTLLENARRMSGEKAEHIASLAQAELDRRAATRPARRKSAATWTKSGGDYAHPGDIWTCTLGDMVMATVRKITNHGNAERDIYEAFVQERKLGTYEKIGPARDAVEAALKARNLLPD